MRYSPRIFVQYVIYLCVTTLLKINLLQLLRSIIPLFFLFCKYNIYKKNLRARAKFCPRLLPVSGETPEFEYRTVLYSCLSIGSRENRYVYCTVFRVKRTTRATQRMVPYGNFAPADAYTYCNYVPGKNGIPRMERE